ncbi:Hypothetical protein SMAX5B_001953 [Scophthalmus maximus]|uniref:Uncharacterized protein n=1 Tax=Scophthalmus maximus TaxID=52904 RepID=A0A2U9BRJ9_SCOMX|nr:Hypothetical protein SMAX5B_001953 [Scophthalmus maximus]
MPVLQMPHLPLQLLLPLHSSGDLTGLEVQLVLDLETSKSEGGRMKKKPRAENLVAIPFIFYLQRYGKKSLLMLMQKYEQKM